MALAAPVPADYPRGVIVVSVQNQTSGDSLVDANTKQSAIKAKSGDTIRYVIEITNKGAKDLVGTHFNSSLPRTISVQDSADPRKISGDMGTLKPGQKVTKEYSLRVTGGKDGEIIAQETCFEGNNSAKDSPQKGCDPVHIAVDSKRPMKLPATGPSAVFAPLLATLSGVAGYIGHRAITTKRAMRRRTN